LDKSMLRCDLQPSPMVGALGTHIIYRLTGAEGEEVTDFRMQSGRLLIALNLNKTLRIGHNQRFAFPVKPKVLVQPRLIEILVNFFYGFTAAFRRPEGHH